MKSNIPIITFFQRYWMLTVFMLCSNAATLSKYEFFKIWTVDMDGKTVYVGSTLFDMLGAVLYVPAISSVIVLVALLIIHLRYRATIDADINDGTYLKDWRALDPCERIRIANFVFVGLVIALCILCSTLAKGSEPDQAGRWNAARSNPHYSIALDVAVSRYNKLAPRYQRITAMRANGAPAPILFCLHQRESSGNFLCHPHEGSPLTHRTRYVPKGRLPNKPPPYTFEESAEDAYYVCDRLDQIDWHDVHKALQGIESFNGLGYQKYHPSVPSPYLWSGTTIYTRGKYTGDGRFDRNAIDGQLGCVAILKRMKDRGIAIGFD